MKEWELSTEAAKATEVPKTTKIRKSLLAAPHLFHFLHHFFHLAELLQQLIDILNVRAGSHRNALAATAVDDGDIRTLFRCHGSDDGLDAAHLLAI